MKWYTIQENVFTRWCNDVLSEKGVEISDLNKDLKSGLALIQLVETLSKSSVGRYNKHPRLDMQKIENISIALTFLQKECQLKMVNIGASDIFHTNTRIILGLIWSIVCHFQIEAEARFKEKNDREDEAHKAAEEKKSKEEITSLLEWVNSLIPDYNITNFRKDWTDGRALCALVDSLFPGAIPDCASKDPADALANATEGIACATKYLGVKALILPEELIHKRVDKLAVKLYISQFRRKRGTSAANQTRAIGPGLINGIVAKPCRFEVRSKSADANVEVNVTGPDGEIVTVDLKSTSELTHAASFKPASSGTYTIAVTVDGELIPGAPFTTEIEEHAHLGGEDKVQVFYPRVASREDNKSLIELEDLFFEKNFHLLEDTPTFEEIESLDADIVEEITKKSKNATGPLVFYDDKFVGNSKDFSKLTPNNPIIKKLDSSKHITTKDLIKRRGFDPDRDIGRPAWRPKASTSYCHTCGNPFVEIGRPCVKCGSEKTTRYEAGSRPSLLVAGLMGNQPKKKRRNSATLFRGGLGFDHDYRRSLTPVILPKEELNLESFIKAAVYRDVPTLMGMINEGFDVNSVDEEGLSALAAATQCGCENTIEFLLANGAVYHDGLEIEDLFIAIDTGNVNIVRHMVPGKLDVNVMDEDGLTPLQLAVEGEHFAIIDWLLKNGAKERGGARLSSFLPEELFPDDSKANTFGINLMSLVEEIPEEKGGGHSNLRKSIVGSAEDLDVDEFFIACYDGDLKIVQKMVFAGIDVNAPDEDGTRPIDIAKETGQDKVVEYLLSQGALE